MPRKTPTFLARAVMAATGLAALAGVARAAAISVIPQPNVVTPQAGMFEMRAATSLIAVGKATPEAESFATALRPATGLPLPVVGAPDGDGAIRFELQQGDTQAAEGAYTLDVTPNGVTIRSASTAGLFYGGQTLRELLPAAAFSTSRPADTRWAVPCVHIEDAPRFAWRGMMLDCSRHFFPATDVKRFIDLLSVHKMNRFHWHLTDDQGWRLEIKKYPKLTQVGSQRAGSLEPDPADPKKMKLTAEPYGGFYTQEDVRDIVAYAAARHVEVVPEIEMPGHSAAAIAAYPELGVSGQPIQVRTAIGVEKHILNPSAATISFYETVLTEVMELFPSPYIHCGGDEVPKAEWKASPIVQERMKSLGMTDPEAMQGWFMGQMADFLAAHHRKMIGWDEILNSTLNPNAVVMSWHGSAGAAKAARQGHDTINASNASAYLDYYQSKDPSEPRAIGGFLPLQKVYDFHVIPNGLSAEAQAHVLGGQGQVWSEFIPTLNRVEYMAYPRACALAEALWSSPDRKSFDDFKERLAIHLDRLKAMNVHYRPLDPTPSK